MEICLSLKNGLFLKYYILSIIYNIFGAENVFLYNIQNKRKDFVSSWIPLNSVKYYPSSH